MAAMAHDELEEWLETLSKEDLIGLRGQIDRRLERYRDQELDRLIEGVREKLAPIPLDHLTRETLYGDRK